MNKKAQAFVAISYAMFNHPLGTALTVGGNKATIGQTPVQHLRSVEFVHDHTSYTALQQNPSKNSDWAKAARAGHRVCQFVSGRDWVAVVVDSHCMLYRNGAVYNANGEGIGAGQDLLLGEENNVRRDIKRPGTGSGACGSDSG